jgi:hypothetical protein
MRARLLLAALALGLLLGVVLLIGRLPHSLAALLSDPGRTRIDQAAVIDRLQSVASLVTTEAAVRDVVTYQNTRLGSTKRSLVVVTGKALVGFDLKNHTRVAIDEPARLLHITLPHATLVAVDVTRLETYDESRGLWNPFRPADRDTIYQLARERLATAAQDLDVVAHAEAGARSVLAALFSSSGYRVEVEFVPFLSLPAAR